MKLNPSFHAVAAAVLLFTAAGVSQARAARIEPPAGAEAIAVPAGHRPFLVVHAKGTQTYTCTAAGTWSSGSVPQADLFAENGNFIGTHFGGPGWQLKDGSRTGAVRVSGITKNPNDIPWLQLQAVGQAAGADGDRLARTTYILRVNTVGGVAPAGGCTVGTTISVPYEADYYFYRADSSE